jgi:hypothetical protein
LQTSAGQSLPANHAKNAKAASRKKAQKAQTKAGQHDPLINDVL